MNRDGEIRAHIPIGTFEVEVFSPDNSWSLAQSLPPITIEPGTNILDPITLAARDLVVLSGSISDAVSGEGIWADVIFVDPSDNMVQFWPEWVHEEGVEPPAPGSFSVRIPAGSYLIKAERFDGLYQSAFYDADGNGEPDIVTVDSGFSESIDIALSSRPTASVTIQLLDENTSEPVKYAWFDFFDAEDEFVRSFSLSSTELILKTVLMEPIL